MENLITKSKSTKTSQIKEMLLSLTNIYTSEADIVMGVLLGTLETRISEIEFIKFCEEMEAA